MEGASRELPQNLEFLFNIDEHLTSCVRIDVYFSTKKVRSRYHSFCACDLSLYGFFGDTRYSGTRNESHLGCGGGVLVAVDVLAEVVRPHEAPGAQRALCTTHDYIRPCPRAHRQKKLNVSRDDNTLLTTEISAGDIFLQLSQIKIQRSLVSRL